MLMSKGGIREIQTLGFEDHGRAPARRVARPRRRPSRGEFQGAARRAAEGAGREAEKLENLRKQEIRSFDSNRAEAERQHGRAVAELEANERRALQDLDTRQRSLGGRVAGLVKGPAHHERQREAVSNNYEKQPP
jgi:hypothetical protein